MKGFVPRILLGIALALSAAASSAGPYPERPIRLVVPWPAGGSSDATARIVARTLGEILGQSMVVDNKPGASGIIGTEFVARSPKDGYTLLWAISNHVTNPLLFKRVPYDPIGDFTPIAVIGYAPYLLAVNPNLPVKSLKEFVEYVRARPGQVSYASAGYGHSSHLGMELLSSMAGLSMLHVPYKGSAPAINDLLGGQVNVYMTTISDLEPHVKASRLRALAVSTLQRVPMAPDVPTFAESGYPDYEIVGYWGVFGPAGVPADVVAKLSSAINNALAHPDTRDKLHGLGLVYEPAGSTPEKFRAFVQRLLPKYTKLIKDAGVTPE